MRILVVIVNYRSAPLVVDCLRSLAGERGGRDELAVCVVDNPGGDDSLAVLQAGVRQHGFQDWVEIVPMPKNGGFGYGVNGGVQPALRSANQPDAFWLLNPDTYVRPGAVRALADFLLAHPEVGMAGSRIEDPDGSPQSSRFRFPGFLNELDNGLGLGLVTRLLKNHIACPPIVDTPHAIDWLSGASMVVRREVFERTGPFDEGFFLYFEETDFSRRAHDLGFLSYYVPQARVVHLVGRSTGATMSDGERRQGIRRPNRVPAYWFASRSRYFRKHHSRLYKLATDLAFALGRASWQLRRILRRRPDHTPPHFLSDFVRHNFWFGRRGPTT